MTPDTERMQRCADALAEFTHRRDLDAALGWINARFASGAWTPGDAATRGWSPVKTHTGMVER